MRGGSREVAFKANGPCERPTFRVRVEHESAVLGLRSWSSLEREIVHLRVVGHDGGSGMFRVELNFLAERQADPFGLQKVEHLALVL